MSDQAAGLSPRLCVLGFQARGEKKRVKPRPCGQSDFPLLLGEQGRAIQFPALSPYPKKPIPLSLCMELQVQSRDGRALLRGLFRVVILQSMIAEVRRACPCPSSSGPHLGESALHINKLSSKTAQPWHFFLLFPNLLPFQTPLARLPCSHMRPNYQNNN